MTAMYRSQQYSLTLTLKPYLYKESPVNQLINTCSSIITILKNPSLNCDGLVVAELTKQFNIHYHGYIYFNTKLKYPQIHFAYLIKQLKSIGRFEIEPVSNQQVWEAYCIKELPRTYDMLSKTNPVIFNYRDKSQKYQFEDCNTDLIKIDVITSLLSNARDATGDGTSVSKPRTVEAI